MLVLSHRGYHATVSENTIEAFEQAVAMGVDGIETDIRLSADGKAILFHDRISPDGREVAALSRQELSDVAGYVVPTVEEALEKFPGVLWNLEIKSPDAVQTAKTIVAHFADSRRILITSFWHDVVEEFRNSTSVECGILLAQRPFNDFTVRQLLPKTKNIETIVWDFDMLDPNLIRSAREHGIRNFVYGAGTVKEHLHLFEIGVDGIITDHPQFVIEASRNGKKAGS
jgi:glycerophosphoryl diester phosphodiesterase